MEGGGEKGKRNENGGIRCRNLNIWILI